MLESARAIERYMSGVTFDAFWDDPVKRDAIVMRITVIGEAAGKVLHFPAVVARLPAVPFSKLKGMRNLIAHDYKGINYRKVWEVTQDHIPQLIAALDDHFLHNPPPTPVSPQGSRSSPKSKRPVKNRPGR